MKKPTRKPTLRARRMEEWRFYQWFIYGKWPDNEPQLFASCARYRLDHFVRYSDASQTVISRLPQLERHLFGLKEAVLRKLSRG